MENASGDVGAVAGIAATTSEAIPLGVRAGGDAVSARHGSGSPYGSGAPISLASSELDEQYPSMRAPADDRMEDLIKDQDDAVFQHGMLIADGVRAVMGGEGRTRHRAPAGQSAAAAEDVETCGLVGLLCYLMTSAAAPRAAVPRGTSHGKEKKNHEPNHSKYKNRELMWRRMRTTTAPTGICP